MLRKLLGKDFDCLSAAEEVAVARLAAMHQRLLIDGGRINTKSEAGFDACVVFLDGLDSAARTLRLDAASRSYRTAFTINYRALFPDESRNYRVDVLEASIEQYAVIWVNGDKFEFSAEAMRRADALQHAWSELSALLGRWSHAAEQPRLSTRPARSELRSAITAVDATWADFEHRYISELIGIEEKARKLVVQAIEHERSLRLLEARYGLGAGLSQLPEYREAQERLVKCISHLNSVANFRRKGRDDLAVSVLFDAVATLQRCDAAEGGTESSMVLGAARILSTDVVESFEVMREYLREVERCLERVDPHLCNNVGLVARLVDWEESWEVGMRYVQHEKLLDIVCDLVAEIRRAQRVCPALIAMCEDCDVELFMVLPRIIWLRFLAVPTQHMELLKTLLPNWFAGHQSRPEADSRQLWPADLDCFVEKFRVATRSLAGAQPPLATLDTGSPGQAAWEVLVKRAVAGAGARDEAYSHLAPGQGEEARAATEELMRELERWSIELQRHCPEDWNQCSAILVQCLGGGAQRHKQSQFQV